jgi:hypothetical protein
MACKQATHTRQQSTIALSSRLFLQTKINTTILTQLHAHVATPGLQADGFVVEAQGQPAIWQCGNGDLCRLSLGLGLGL